MFLKQYYLGCLSHASYLIADERTKVAAVVDPQRDVDQYLEAAQQAGWQIQHVFLTHFHADFVSGHIELRKRTGATIHLGHRGEAEYAVQAAHDGDEITFGDVRIRILETPGHTPEGISLLVFDQAVSSDIPSAVLTGDTLFIGDVGRPDLMASVGVTADELASQLYDSVRRLAELPDSTLVYPAHGAGSMCGKNLSSETVSTIGEQKKYNYALQPMSRADFMKLVEIDQPDAPDYFGYDAVLNRQDRPALDETLQKSVVPVPVDEFLNQQQRGAQIVDVRDGLDFAGGHLRLAVNIGLRGKYATWAGSLLKHGQQDPPILVIADPGDEAEAIMRLGRIGFDNVAGYLAGGMAALDGRSDLLQTTERVTATRLREWRQAASAPVVIDVRTAGEYQQGHIPGSLNLPLNHLSARRSELPTKGPLVVHCAGGYRSAIAASLLQRHGYQRVIDLVGGYGAWQASRPGRSAEPTTGCSISPGS